MKRNLAFLLLCLTVSMAACSSTDEPKTATATPDAKSAASPEPAKAADPKPAAPVDQVADTQPAPTKAPAAAAPIIVPLPDAAPAKQMRGWLAYRGPNQNGTSEEKNLPDTWELGGKNDLWTYKIQMRGTPVIANGKLYGVGYEGEKFELQEVLFCLDAETGKELWKFKSNDFLSDVVYDRYAIGAPAVDPETGNVFYLSTPGILYSFSPDGKVIWQISMAERYGRNTYPNGRTGAPVIEGDLVITRGVTNNWGGDGPPNDRFYAFEKSTGDLVWSVTPGVGPPFLKDSSVSHPHVITRDNKRIFFAGTGDGNVVCINALTGEAIWRYQYCVGGIGSSTIVHGDGVIAVHGLEQPPGSPYGSEQGAITKLRIDAKGVPAEAGKPGAPALEQSAVMWRNKIAAFTSSPILVGDRVYQTAEIGVLACFDANTGKKLWEKKYAPDQIHAGPVYGDGKLYVPFNNGTFVIVKPTDEGPEELSRVKLEGNLLGAPAIWNGKVYVSSTQGLRVFGAKRDKDESPLWPAMPTFKAGPPVKLQPVPAEIVMHPSETQKFKVRAVDANGHVAGMVKDFSIDYFIPPTARVKSKMDVKISEDGTLTTDADPEMSAGSLKFTSGKLAGNARGRVLGGLPYKEDFEGFDVSVEHETEMDAEGKPSKFAYPPLAWIKARFSWEIRELDGNPGGNKVLAKTLDRLILQRAQTFIEDDSLSDYTMQVDLMTDGNRRLASDVGVIHQRYLITLKGNHQQLEVASNVDRLQAAVPFRIDAKKWYTLKTRVDVKDDGTGVIRVKAWNKGDAEPEAWTMEVPVANAHQQGSPGLYGFAINGKFRVYIDNISVTANEKK